MCLSCMGPSYHSRTDSWRSRGLKNPGRMREDAVMLDAPLTPDLKDQLDSYVTTVLNAGGYASLCPTHRLLRDLSAEKARDTLMVYAEVSRDWCRVDPVKRGGVYHFMSYKDEDEPTDHRLFDPNDFKVIDRYIANHGKPTVVNAKLVCIDDMLSTEETKQWLLIRSYFGLHPAHKILWRGVIVARENKAERFCDTYLIGEADDQVPDMDEGRKLAITMYKDEINASG